MGTISGKPERNDNESNRKRQNPDSRFSSSRRREVHQRLLNETIEQNEAPTNTTLYDLPLEMLDIILQKSYLHGVLNSSTKQTNEEVISSLISVDVCFNRKITRQRFKKAIWRHLKDFYRKSKKRSAILRNNRNYLLENIQPNDEFIASLLSLNCLTEEQSHVIKRQRINRDKNIELLYVMETFDELKFSRFVKCLRQTNQKTVARIMENGGGAIKIKVQTRGERCTASMNTQLLHQKIEDLRTRTKPMSLQTYELISQLREEGLEILNSQLERQTVFVWIRCRSQAALANCQRLYDSNQLRDVFFENIQPSISKVISIDRNQFKKTVIVCPFSITFTQRIEIGLRENDYVYRVTKLRNEIYVLLQPSSSSSPHPVRVGQIHVFDDQSPFHSQKIINLTQLRMPVHIASSEKENCLYVSDYRQRCVWKIINETDDQHKIITWLNTGQILSLSVSSDGYLLVVSDSSSILRIYGSDAELIRSIQLPKDIQNPRHAVETSVGNFIILHSWTQKKGESGSNGGGSLIKWGICELTRDGQMVIRRFIPSYETQQLKNSVYFSLDSDDRVFMADSENGRVILLDSNLRWNQILLPTNEEEETSIRSPYGLCYDEENKQLIVGGDRVNVYTLSRR